MQGRSLPLDQILSAFVRSQARYPQIFSWWLLLSLGGLLLLPFPWLFWPLQVAALAGWILLGSLREHILVITLRDGMAYRHRFSSKATALAHRNGIRRAIGQPAASGDDSAPPAACDLDPAHGSELRFEGLEGPVTVVRGIGAGSQGQVFEAELGGERLAIKWYFPACLKRDPQLRRRLEESIRRTAPSDSFLWPLALLRPTPATARLLRLAEPGFGSLMALRPERYIGVHEHTGGHVAISLRTALRAAFRLADAFHHLHLRGLCYKDISLGNLFLDPADGAILICDNDNVDVDGRDPGSVLGTPGFMAPEVLLGAGPAGHRQRPVFPGGADLPAADPPRPAAGADGAGDSLPG